MYIESIILYDSNLLKTKKCYRFCTSTSTSKRLDKPTLKDIIQLLIHNNTPKLTCSKSQVTPKFFNYELKEEEKKTNNKKKKNTEKKRTVLTRKRNKEEGKKNINP